MRQVLVVGLVLITFLAAVGAVFWRSNEAARQTQSRSASPYLPPAPVKTAGPVEESDGRVVTEVTPEVPKAPAHKTTPVAVAMPKLPAAPSAPSAPAAPQWEVAYQDTFSDAEAAKRVFPLGGGIVSYFEPKKALLLRSADQGEVTAAIHKQLPGDLRVRFKALRAKAAEEVAIGFFFSNNGNPSQMDGYFAEWARGTAQIKRERRILKCVDAPTPKTDDRWVNIELRRIGSAITLLMEGKEVLAYTDAQPIADAEHDLCAFYVWSDQTLIRDLVIERNTNDGIKPLQSDPASKANLIDGARSSDREHPADF